MQEKMLEYMSYLEWEEKSAATRQQYRRDILKFLSYLGANPLTRELVIRYKKTLQETYCPITVNVKLAALNGFFSFIGRSDLRVKRLVIQHTSFRPKEKELTKAEYMRLLQEAERRKDQRLLLLLKTICGTGIRVSELQYITVEAVRRGEAVIQLKGKTRVIFLCGKLKKLLWDYIRRQKIKAGPVFVTRNGKPLDRSNIWKLMKSLCAKAGVARQKAFPHNLRRLFARCFYAVGKDIAKLADLLGHTSINTTRIYIISTGVEHQKYMDSLGLVV